MKYSIVFAAVAAPLASAQVGMWGQCGGMGYSGQTQCGSGAVCSTLNPYYAQCLPGTASTTMATTTRATTTPVTTTAVTTTAVVTTAPTTTRSTTTTTRTTTSSAPVGSGLDNLIKSKGKKYVGSCADPGTLSNSNNVAILKAEFGCVTPENSMKWDSIEPSRGGFNYGNSDQLANWATSNGKLIRGHTLVWYSQLPSWVQNINDKTTLTSVIQNHVTTIMNRYKGKIYAWDVANEIFEDNGSFRTGSTSVFHRVLGKDAFKIAFRAARAADPNAKLCLNDYNLDYAGAKLTNFVAFVNEMISEGVPIDCVGTQSHLVGGNSAIPYFKSTLDTLASTGLEVQITELDIRVNTPPSSSVVAQQVKDYQTVAKACMDLPQCAGITIWGVSDANSWIPGVFSGQGSALLWDNNYQKKSLYNGFVNGINGIAA